MCFAPQLRALFRHLNFQKWSENGVFCTFWLGNVLRATTACTFSTSKSGPNIVFCSFWLGNVLRAATACTFSTSQLPNVVRPWCALCILTCTQRRALFRDLNFQKWSEHGVFCTCWLRNVLRHDGVACTFSTSQLPKGARDPGVLYLFTWNCASRHNGLQFFISHLASWLRTRRFSEPTCRPSGAPDHWKNRVFRDFPAFSRICIFFLLTLSLLLFSLLIFLFSLPLPCSAFHLSLLSEVWLLNFLRTYTWNMQIHVWTHTHTHAHTATYKAWTRIWNTSFSLRK